MTAQIEPEMGYHERWAAEMPAQVSSDVLEEPRPALTTTGFPACERAVRVMNRRPHFVWLDIQSYFRLSDAEMESTFGPCPGDPGAVSVNAFPHSRANISAVKMLNRAHQIFVLTKPSEVRRTGGTLGTGTGKSRSR